MRRLLFALLMAFAALTLPAADGALAREGGKSFAAKVCTGKDPQTGKPYWRGKYESARACIDDYD
jgi:hypothetical protein